MQKQKVKGIGFGVEYFTYLFSKFSHWLSVGKGEMYYFGGI